MVNIQPFLHLKGFILKINMVEVQKQSTEFYSAGVANQDGTNSAVTGNGQVYRNGAAVPGEFAPFTFNNGDLIGCGVNPDIGSIDYFKNGTYVYTLTGISGTPLSARVGHNASSAVTATINCGQQPFAASNVTHNIDAGTVEIDGETYGTLYQPLGSTTATLTIADAGTLGLIEGTPTMTAKVGGATGTYVSHTDTELVLGNTNGTWSTASETAISDTELTIAAIDPNDFVMTSSEFSATPLEATHGSSTWQVTEVADTTYASPVIDVTSESALTTYNAGGLEGDTTYRARVKHTSSNDVDSLWSEEVHQNIFKTEPALLDTPDATMYGLRFDSDRETQLYKEFSGQSNTYTISCWAKATTPTENGYIFTQVSSALAGSPQYNDITGLGVNAGNYRWYASDSNIVIGTATANTWTHLVVKVEAGSVTTYINGVEGGTGTTPSLIDDVWRIGVREANQDFWFNGYLSDIYFVDGHALEPTEFGSLFPQDPSAADRRWGPLDSSVVTANINNYEPTPDVVPNYDQKWSDSLVNTGSYFGGSSAAQAFDGDTSTAATVLNNSTRNQALIIRPIPCSKVQFSLSPQGDGNQFYKINGGDPTPQAVKPWKDLLNWFLWKLTKEINLILLVSDGSK